MQSHQSQATQHNSRRPRVQPKTPISPPPPFTGDRATDDLAWDIWAVENGYYTERKVFPQTTTPTAHPPGATDPRASSSTADAPAPPTNSRNGRQSSSRAARPRGGNELFFCSGCNRDFGHEIRKDEHEDRCLPRLQPDGYYMCVVSGCGWDSERLHSVEQHERMAHYQA